MTASTIYCRWEDAMGPPSPGVVMHSAIAAIRAIKLSRVKLA
ncbi:hypothetical protein [Oscillatoria sp. HE19RPO]|nr:hypothetical protein [Oscillatoria sp. HE19RPO]